MMYNMRWVIDIYKYDDTQRDEKSGVILQQYSKSSTIRVDIIGDSGNESTDNYKEIDNKNFKFITYKLQNADVKDIVKFNGEFYKIEHIGIEGDLGLFVNVSCSKTTEKLNIID
ncbi:hypothetical protein [Carboxylicivirga sp. M1479]|uniref:hypothetical protein n=1 Tax=Carboxylicivirga sp. M1479 TaxID=2594476 RepID=UPI00117798F5|nr:hypothetical protein [Carboxylicivirga sp. M1479]TRX71509.1 hypothetical protein FNN09_05940 [Carboxylicivirga sp. M1479]